MTKPQNGVASKKSTYWINHWQMYLLLVPGLTFLIIFKFAPLIGLAIAFKDFQILIGNNIFDSMLKSEWVGFKNFADVFNSKDFFKVLGNTLIISTYKIIFLFPLPIFLSILMNELKNKYFKKTIQTFIYLPHFLSWVVVFGLFFTIFSSDGILNTFLTQAGMNEIRFFSDKRLFRSLLVISEGWKEGGWDSIVYLAAITSISPELYEAAMVDGANKWKQMLNITLPSILPVIILMLILRVGNILNAGFEQILVMYNQQVYDVADIIDTYVYRKGLGTLNFSMGTAMGLFNSVIAFILVTSCNFLSKRATGKGIW